MNLGIKEPVISKFWKTQKFYKLNAKWQKKLADSGFEDIEDTNSPREMLKCWHSQYFQVKYTPEQVQARQSYYETVGHILHETRWRNRVHKEIWRLHAEGYSLRETSYQLHQSGMAEMGKDTVNSILTMLKKKLMR